jgi:transposase InsO family protein
MPASRYLLTCEALSSTREDLTFTVFERLFKERGLPANIRSDNGVPFASAHALFNLSRLAVWWLRLGIGIERIRPGHPQENDRHERMHLTLKKETHPRAVLRLPVSIQGNGSLWSRVKIAKYVHELRPIGRAENRSRSICSSHADYGSHDTHAAFAAGGQTGVLTEEATIDGDR